MLKWHPDKHPEGPKELFDEAFKHLQNEVIRLEMGGFRQSQNARSRSSRYDDIFKRAHWRAREDRARFTRFGGYANGQWRRGTEYTDFRSYFKQASRAPDHRNARRWFNQAKEDLRAAFHDFDPPDDPSLEWVAFKCQRATEKGLKAAQLATSGTYSFTHSICSLAYSVKDTVSNGDELVANVSKLYSKLVSDQRTRYPDRCAFSEIPHEVYSSKDIAQEAMDLTQNILHIIECLIKRN